MADAQAMTHVAGDVLFCQPVTVSYFRVENSIWANGIRADIRHFAWERACDARFEADSHYLDFSLGPRAHGARLLSEGRRNTPPFGEVAYLPKGAQFEARCEPSEYSVLCLTFDSLTSERIFEDSNLPSSLPPCFDVRIPWVRQGLARLAQEVRSPGFAQDMLVETIALSLVIELCRHLRAGEAADDMLNVRMADWRLRRLQERIEAGLAGPLSIVDLAQECGLSSRHLMRTFKNTVGTTISNYISDARIARAKRELVEEGAMVKVVAGNCGFQSAAAFSAAFRKATGLSPRRFRQERLYGAR